MLKDKISVGTVQFRKNYGISNIHGRITDFELFKILRICNYNNVFSFDNAKNYGSSEKRIGKFFKNNSNVPGTITTKIFNDSLVFQRFQNSISNPTITSPNFFASFKYLYDLDTTHQLPYQYILFSS